MRRVQLGRMLLKQYWEAGSTCQSGSVTKHQYLGWWPEHCRCRSSNTCKGSGTVTVGEYGSTMTASSMMDITWTGCNKFGKEQLKSTLKDMQYNLKSTSTCSVLEKPSNRAGSLVATKKVYYWWRTVQSLSATRAGKRIFSDLVMIKVPTYSGIAIAN